MTDTANAPERIWTADTTGNCSVGFNTPSLDYKNEYISRTHCDELVAAAYLDATQVLEDEIDLARIALPQAVPVLRADIRAIKNRTPTKAKVALTARDERMKAEGALGAQAKIARLTEALINVLNACDQGRMVPAPGHSVGGMSIDANIRGSVYHGVPAWPIEEARAALQENANG
jgi:hypothetical protein